MTTKFEVYVYGSSLRTFCAVQVNKKSRNKLMGREAAVGGMVTRDEYRSPKNRRLY